MKTRDEYVAKMKDQLDRWNAEAARWEAEAGKGRVEAKKRYGEQLDQLKARREEALYNLKLLEGASASAWQDLRKGTEAAWKSMSDAMSAARVHFEKRP